MGVMCGVGGNAGIGRRNKWVLLFCIQRERVAFRGSLWYTCMESRGSLRGYVGCVTTNCRRVGLYFLLEKGVSPALPFTINTQRVPRRSGAGPSFLFPRRGSVPVLLSLKAPCRPSRGLPRSAGTTAPDTAPPLPASGCPPWRAGPPARPAPPPSKGPLWLP